MAREQFEEPVLPWHEPLEQSERPELPGNRRRRGKRGDRQTGGRLGRRNEASDQILEAGFIEGLDGFLAREQIGRASCRERVCQYVSISVVAGSSKKKNHHRAYMMTPLIRVQI